MEQVILVNERDEQIGVEEKHAAHMNGGRLHRAFSIFVFNGLDELLLQRRAWCKYHFGGLWSNTCCGHPRPGESVIDAACRRLHEELGIATALIEVGTLLYEAADEESGLVEREFLHVLVGRFDGEPLPNHAEVEGWLRLPIDTIRRDMAETPERYTPWFEIALDVVENRR